MRFGICIGIEYPERVAIARQAGFDYIEGGFCTLSRGSDEVFDKFKAALEENNIKCEAANGFFPKDLVLLGRDYDENAVKAYIEKGFERGSKIGLEKIAFGSGKARSIPEGMSYKDAFLALGRVLGEVVSPLAEKYSITVVTEPLRKNECNIINTVKEGVMLSALSGRDNISTLADIYHMLGEGDTLEDIRQLKGCLRHSHISNPFPANGNKRAYPLNISEFDYEAFIEAMEFAGCDTCSLEAPCTDFEREASIAGRLLKSI